MSFHTLSAFFKLWPVSHQKAPKHFNPSPKKQNGQNSKKKNIKEKKKEPNKKGKGIFVISNHGKSHKKKIKKKFFYCLVIGPHSTNTNPELMSSSRFEIKHYPFLFLTFTILYEFLFI